MNGLDGGSSADVDAAFVNGKYNLLFAWETTNAVFNTGRTAAQVIQDANDYIAARLAAHPTLKIIMLRTLPRQVGPVVTDLASRIERNQTNDAVDAYFAANYRACGLSAFVDIRRSGSPWAFTDYTDASFAANDSLWYEAAGGRVHLVNAGYAIVAGWCAEIIRRLPSR